jgi:phage baseplate assembly protein W
VLSCQHDPTRPTVLTALRTAAHRFMVRQRLQEIAYAANDRQMRETLGSAINDVCRRGVRSGWTARTTAAVLAAIWIGALARNLPQERRMRIAQVILKQEKAARTPLDWFEEYGSGRLNVVGTDLFLLRYNVASGTLATWVAERRSVDAGVRRIFAAMAAWGLAGISEEEAEQRFGELLSDLDL